MTKFRKALVGSSVVGAVLALTAGIASAQETPPADATELATEAATDLAPMMLAVAGAFLALLVISIGIRFVWGMARRNGR